MDKLTAIAQMWFHQDDLSWMKLAQRPWLSQLTIPVAEHINYVFRFFFKLEYQIFRWNYPGYLAVSVLMHVGVAWLIALITAKITKKRELAMLAGLLFLVNTNWNETVMWVSGQTILISALFTLATVYHLVRKTNIMWWGLLLWLTSMTSALTVWLPVVTVGVFWQDKKIRWSALTVILWIAGIYYLRGNGETGVSINWLEAAVTGGLMIINTLIGRWWWPWEVGEKVRIGITAIAGGLFVWKWGKGLWEKIRHNRESWFLLLSLVSYYAVVALGRSRYGIGIMRAERYAYLGLALLLPVLMWMIKEFKIKFSYVKWIALGLGLIQIFGFVDRASRYTTRPRQLYELHRKIESLDKTKCYQDGDFPTHVFGEGEVKLSEYAGLWKGLKIGGAECGKMW